MAVGMGALFWSGCASRGAGRSLLGRPSIDEIHVLTMPMALNLDQNPGADGFAVKIYAIDQAHPKSVAVTAGSLEVLIYDGMVPAAALATNAPIRRWEFGASDLAAYAQSTSVGVVYALTPTWRDGKPPGEKITVTACYLPPGGEENGRRVCSLPTTVTVALPSGYR